MVHRGTRITTYLFGSQSQTYTPRTIRIFNDIKWGNILCDVLSTTGFMQSGQHLNVGILRLKKGELQGREGNQNQSMRNWAIIRKGNRKEQRNSDNADLPCFFLWQVKCTFPKLPGMINTTQIKKGVGCLQDFLTKVYSRNEV